MKYIFLHGQPNVCLSKKIIPSAQVQEVSSLLLTKKGLAGHKYI